MKHALLLLSVLFVGACSSQADNDQPSEAGHNPLGTGERLRDVQNPALPTYAPNQNVNISSVVVTAVDSFDETANGKSIGTIFVQDVDKAGPYAGISLYSPTYIPGNLRLAPGDVIDMVGDYSQQTTIGTTVTFPAGSFLPQMNKPQVTQAFEVSVPAPVVINLSDLDGFSTGSQWLGMLVTVMNVTPGALADSGGRVTAPLDGVSDGPEVNNELFNLQTTAFPAGTHFTSITGIVDFFFNFFICPRSMADLQQ